MPAAGRHGAGDGRGRRSPGGERRRDAAGLPQRVRLLRRAARRRADDARRDAHLPRVRAALRAAPRGPLARRRAAADRAGAAAARRGARAGGGGRDGRPAAGARRRACGASRASRRAHSRRRRAAASGGRCELCPISLADDHKHLLDLEERRIVCVCPTCWSMRSGEARYRPTGSRTLWLDGLELSDELWAAFQIPIGLAFFLRSTETGGSSACTRARRARPSASSTSTPGTGSSPRTPCSRTSIPTPRR